MHGIEGFFLNLAAAIQNIWRARSMLARQGWLDDASAARRSRAIMTAFCIAATLFLLALGAGVVFLFWWAFTIHERA